jgi:phage N-6-adenine-methyltransferase
MEFRNDHREMAWAALQVWLQIFFPRRKFYQRAYVLTPARYQDQGGRSRTFPSRPNQSGSLNEKPPPSRGRRDTIARQPNKGERMTSEVIPRPHANRELQQFDPAIAKSVIETLKQAVVYAHRMQQWDEGMEAALLLVQWERDFVDWWNANVGVRHGSGQGKAGLKNADLRSLISKDKAEADTKITAQQVSRWRNGLRRPDYAARIFSIAHKKAMADSAQRRADLQTGEMEWFTPALYVEKARRVLGDFDLDPASCAMAQETVQARHFYTVEDDGLEQDWNGNVWLNPPYAGKLIAAFAGKLIDQLECGNVDAAMMLTNSYTETSWFHNLAKSCNALCVTRGRIKFESPHGEKCAPTNGQCFFYFGDERPRFIAEFSEVGTILVRP